jgi:polysaccharide pyruvyl transferase WcaK-like protein
MTMKKIAIVGAFGIGSLGDEIGLSVLKQALDGYAELTVYMRCPNQEYAGYHGVKVRRKLEHSTRGEAKGRFFRGLNTDDNPDIIGNLAEEFSEFDLIILGPGDFFNEDCRCFLRGALPEMVLMAWIAQMAGTPYMIYAASARYLISTYAVYQAKWLIGNAAVVTFRDPVSIANIFDSGIKTNNSIYLLPDPVRCFTPPCPSDRVDGRLFLSVRSLAYKGHFVLEQYRKIIDSVLSQYDGEVYPIPMFRSDDGYPDDVDEARVIYENSLTPSSLQETTELISSCSRALVTRLHAAVLCYNLGIPFLAISYEPKVKGFCKSVGAEYVEIIDGPDGVYERLMKTKPIPVEKRSMKGYVEHIKKIIE